MLGVFIVNITSQGDTLFPHELVYGSTKHLPIDVRVTMRGGSHFEPSARPKEIADLITHIIQSKHR